MKRNVFYLSKSRDLDVTATNTQRDDRFILHYFLFAHTNLSEVFFDINTHEIYTK